MAAAAATTECQSRDEDVFTLKRNYNMACNSRLLLPGGRLPSLLRRRRRVRGRHALLPRRSRCGRRRGLALRRRRGRRRRRRAPVKECVLCAINCVVLLLGIKNECAGRVDRCPQCLECAQRLQVRLRSWLVEGPARNMVGKMAPLKPKTLEPSEPPRPPKPPKLQTRGHQ